MPRKDPIVKATKNHTCKLCDGIIPIGTTHYSSNYAAGKRHIECEDKGNFYTSYRLQQNHPNEPLYNLNRELHISDLPSCCSIKIKNNTIVVSTCAGYFKPEECITLITLSQKYNIDYKVNKHGGYIFTF